MNKSKKVIKLAPRYNPAFPPKSDSNLTKLYETTDFQYGT